MRQSLKAANICVLRETAFHFTAKAEVGFLFFFFFNHTKDYWLSFAKEIWGDTGRHNSSRAGQN